MGSDSDPVIFASVMRNPAHKEKVRIRTLFEANPDLHVVHNKQTKSSVSAPYLFFWIRIRGSTGSEFVFRIRIGIKVLFKKIVKNYIA